VSGGMMRGRTIITDLLLRGGRPWGYDGSADILVRGGLIGRIPVQGRPGGGHRPAQEPQLGDPRGRQALAGRGRGRRGRPSLRWATAKPERAANGAKGKGGEFNDDAPF
jgi:hypothetical protein